MSVASQTDPNSHCTKEELMEKIKQNMGCNFLLVDLNESDKHISDCLFAKAKAALKKSKAGFLGLTNEVKLAQKI